MEEHEGVVRDKLEQHDEFRKMFYRQQKFLDKVLERDGYDPDALSVRERTELTKIYVLCLIKEATEVLDDTDWKPHRRHPDRRGLSSYIEVEIIDVFKYCLVLAQIWGMTPECFVAQFHSKSSVVESLFKQKSEE
jgi:hypothetical protein